MTDVSRRKLIATLSAIGIGSVAGCSSSGTDSRKESRKSTEPTISELATDSQWNDMATEYGWPPTVPKKPDRKGINTFERETWLYSWMAAAQIQELNQKMEEQNELLRKIERKL